MRIITVKDLIYALEELPEDMPIMAQHQPSWPLREYIGGVWVDDGREKEEQECESCGKICLDEPRETRDEDQVFWVSECINCHYKQEVPAPMPKEDEIAYIVLNGHPYDSTPYGSKRAWNEI